MQRVMVQASVHIWMVHHHTSQNLYNSVNPNSRKYQRDTNIQDKKTVSAKMAVPVRHVDYCKTRQKFQYWGIRSKRLEQITRKLILPQKASDPEILLVTCLGIRLDLGAGLEWKGLVTVVYGGSQCISARESQSLKCKEFCTPVGKQGHYLKLNYTNLQWKTY